MTTELYAPLAAGDVRLVPLAEAHREALRTVAAAVAAMLVGTPED